MHRDFMPRPLCLTLVPLLPCVSACRMSGHSPSFPRRRESSAFQCDGTAEVGGLLPSLRNPAGLRLPSVLRLLALGRLPARRRRLYRRLFLALLALPLRPGPALRRWLIGAA